MDCKSKEFDEIVTAAMKANNFIHSCNFEGYTYGQFVLTGLQAGGFVPIKQVGYCVQVRKGCGQFGSDMVFLRHADGSLTTHENQSFYPLTEDQEADLRPFFETLPEQEDPALGYLCCNKVHEVGFMIENSASQPTPAEPFMITTTDGSGKKTVTAII